MQLSHSCSTTCITWYICASCVSLASSPGPFPAFQCWTLKSRRAWYAKSRAWRHDTSYCDSQRSLCEAASFELQILKEGLLVHYLLVKWSYYNQLYILEPYLWPATNRSAHKTADLWPAYTHQTFCLYLVYLLSTYDIAHVTSRTRPSCFSACNIEKLGMGLGMRLA